MADSFLAQKLTDFTDPDHAEPLCHRPFTLQLDGQPWSVACAGPWLFALRGTSSHTSKEASDTLLRLLRTPPLEAEEVATEKLKVWAGEPYQAGKGQIAPGQIFGRCFDRRRLAALLGPIPFPKLLVWDLTDALGVVALGLESKGKWRGVLAGLTGDAAETTPGFTFREPLGVSLMSELPED